MKSKKILVGALASVAAISPVFAETITTNTAGTQNTTVSYNSDSSYTITIPKTIALNTDSKTGTYEVNVTGDLLSTETVTVNPASTFVMRNTNGTKADVTATVTQSLTEWTYANLGTETTGTIVASGLSAGTWEGTLTFNIEYENTGSTEEDGPGEPTAETISFIFNGVTYQAEADMTWDEWLASDYGKDSDLSIHEQGVLAYGSRAVYSTSSYSIAPSDKIIAGETYTIGELLEETIPE